MAEVDYTKYHHSADFDNGGINALMIAAQSILELNGLITFSPAEVAAVLYSMADIIKEHRDAKARTN